MQESFLELVDIGELKIEHRPGILSRFRMPTFESYETLKKNIGKEPVSVSATPAESAPPQNLHPRRICTPAESAPPQNRVSTPAESRDVSLLTPEVPLKDNIPPTPPQAGGTATASSQHPAAISPTKPQVQNRDEKIIECVDGICRVKLGNRRRLFTRRELEATAGTLWTCAAMSEFLRRRNFQVKIEQGAIEHAPSAPASRVRPEVLQRAAAR